jgi:AraC-like DNA-binding protein
VREILWVSSREARTQILLPETTLTMVFRLSGHATLQGQPLPHSIVSGLQKRARIVEHSASSSVLVVRFTEIGASSILHDRADLLFSRTAALDALIPRQAIETMHNQLNDAGDARRQLPLIEDFLSQRLRAQPMPPASIQAAAKIIRESGGTVSISQLARRVAMSQSGLERRLRAYTGASPKMLSRLARLQRIVRLWDEGHNLTQIAVEAGYTDQPHMIRDFLSLAGMTPRAFFQRHSPRNLPTFYK